MFVRTLDRLPAAKEAQEAASTGHLSKKPSINLGNRFHNSSVELESKFAATTADDSQLFFIVDVFC